MRTDIKVTKERNNRKLSTIVIRKSKTTKFKKLNKGVNKINRSTF